MKPTVVVLALAVGTMSIAVAAPPPDADPSLKSWFEGLHQPGNGASCCSISDCHRLADGDWRETADGYQVRIRGQWVTVPPSRILAKEDNPTGGAVACYDEMQRVIYCFVRSSET